MLTLVEIVLFFLSVKSPKENEWILDPVVIADVLGPEVLQFLLAVYQLLTDLLYLSFLLQNGPFLICANSNIQQAHTCSLM